MQTTDEIVMFPEKTAIVLIGFQNDYFSPEGQLYSITEKIFTAKISDEVRTPLNAIVGLAHLLEETPTIPEQSDYLQIVRDSSEILLELINYVLDFQKIQCDKVVSVN